MRGKIVKLETLRSRMGAIPGKLLVAVLLSFGVYWRFSFEKFMEDPVQNIFILMVIYGMVSYFWLCVKATRNWIIGFVVALGLIFLLGVNMDKLSGFLQFLIRAAICFGGVVMDVIYIVRYFMIKGSIHGGE